MRNYSNFKGELPMDTNQDIISKYMEQIHHLLSSLNLFAQHINDSQVLEIPPIGNTPVENSIYLGVILKNVEHIISLYRSGVDKLESIEKLIVFTIEKILEKNNLTEVNDSKDIKISYVKCPPKLVIFDPEKLKYYFIEKKEVMLDKQSVIKDLKEGKQVEGAQLVRDRKVRVKFKPIIVKK